MSVESVEELFLQRPGRQDQSGTFVTRTFRVITSTSTDTSLVALSASQGGTTIPDVGDDHPDSTDLWVATKSADPESNDGMHWIVKANYELKPPAGTGGTGNTKPWDLDPNITFGYAMKSRVMEYCYHGSLLKNDPIPVPQVVRDQPLFKVVNSIQQPFDPPAQSEDAMRVISIQRNIEQSDYDPNERNEYQNTINSDQERVAGIDIPALQGWIRDIKAQKMWTDQNEPYWSETIEIFLNPETWLRQILDQGFFTAAAAGGYLEYTPIKDTDDNPIRDPILLDGNGERNPANNDPVYWYFHDKWELNWGGLELPEDY